MLKARRLLVVLTVATGALAFAGVGATAPSSAADASTGNLLVNGDAELGGPGGTGQAVAVPGWSIFVPGACNVATKGPTIVRWASPGGFPNYGSPGPASRGTNFFAGGPSCSPPVSKPYTASLAQCVDISAHAAAINHGLAEFFLTGYFGGFKSQSDRSRARVTFYMNSSCGGGSLGTTSTSFVTSGDRANITGLLYRDIGSGNFVPHLGLSAYVVLEFRHVNGGYNDGYADNVDFDLLIHS